MKVQQELMRHASIQTTVNVYGHAMNNSKRDANSKVGWHWVPKGLQQRERPLLGVYRLLLIPRNLLMELFAEGGLNHRPWGYAGNSQRDHRQSQT